MNILPNPYPGAAVPRHPNVRLSPLSPPQETFPAVKACTWPLIMQLLSCNDFAYFATPTARKPLQVPGAKEE